MKKGLVVGIIVLFLGVSIQPSLSAEIPDKIEVEPKDYLFQTIIDIANKPKVKELLEQYNYDIIKSDLKGKSLFLKLLFKKPKLFFDIFFTKPSITHEYLDKCYNNGIEIVNIIGEDKVLEMRESIKFTNTEVLDKLDNIIKNDEELSGRIAALNEMNEEYESYLPWEFPIICTIVEILFLPIGTLFLFSLMFVFWNFIKPIFPELIPVFALIALILFIPYIILEVIGLVLGCDMTFTTMSKLNYLPLL